MQPLLHYRSTGNGVIFLWICGVEGWVCTGSRLVFFKNFRIQEFKKNYFERFLKGFMQDSKCDSVLVFFEVLFRPPTQLSLQGACKAGPKMLCGKKIALIWKRVADVCQAFAILSPAWLPCIASRMLVASYVPYKRNKKIKFSWDVMKFYNEFSQDDA